METITKSILLIDESFDFKNLKKFLNNNAEIISFDIFSHKYLEKKNIKHILSDSFLSENDYKEIQEKSYELEKWYDLEELKPLLLFKNINIGQLTYVDTVYFITKSLKKFFEILKIHEKYHENNFITTESISKILNFFTKSFQNIEGKLQPIQYHKHVHYDYKIGKFNMGLNISFKNYKKFKKLSERFFSVFFNPKNIPIKNKSVLLVEFDPVKFQNLLLKSKSTPVTFILYNKRKPSIWDKNSFNILKKSGTKIISSNLIDDTQIIDECGKKTNYYEQIVSKILDKQNIPNAFEFRGYDLWPFFKNTLIQLILNNLKPTIFEILSVQKLFDTYNIDSIMINSENSSTENIVMNLAKIKKIPILLMQHGMIYDSKDFLLRNHLIGIYPNHSDYAIVWGQLMKNHLVSLGYEQNKIKDLGCPIYDDITFKSVKKTDTILVATSPPMNDFSKDLSVDTNLNYEKAIKEICIFCKNSNLNLIFKLHPSLEDNIQQIIKENYEDAEIVSIGSIIPLIKKCSLMITFDLSTTILESQLLSTPVISMFYRDNHNLNLEIFDDSCLRVPIENFEEIITKIIHDDIFRNELIEKGTNFSKLYLSHQNDSSLSILDFLEKI